MGAWEWRTTTTPRDPGFPYSTVDVGVAPPGTVHEAALYAEGRVDDWDFDVWGVEPDTTMLDTKVDAGRWLAETGAVSDGPVPAVMASHGARDGPGAVRGRR